ncbi:hypothetical protein DRW03_20170 [Corallococcus sp. H22C18031201]|uniref:YcnI family copper-binding membrane protein n=1 Tax=Citreicoccus inhibens TaxID=2849499 RepID=UPI000E742158|nr:YcnI family protein [Citreicoccus inhibens]MBU8895651.1 YcnI family protein [Citreicoccus inhibens]RJS20084.1 hypothetical protein DRW03_20170 [Corallococcus sp. H22C18031201]
MKFPVGTLFALAGSLLATSAQAHVSVTGPGPAVAGASFDADFTLSHGCSGADTFRVRIAIPEGVTSVRPMDSVFGKAVVEKDAATGNVTAVTWTKASADVLAADTQLYRFTLRAKMPGKPFTTLYFPTTQTCRAADGTESTVEWVGTSGGHDHEGGDAGTTPAAEPAPSLFLVPSRLPGWNKYTVTEHVHDLTVFKDALIVWSGTAAYSFNPVTQAQIEQEPGVQPLAEIHPGTDIWVKY